MAPKKKPRQRREEEEEEEVPMAVDEGAEQEEEAPGDGAAAANGRQAQQPQRRAGAAGRAEQAADIARRRAAHFARFQDENEAEDGNVHVGGDNARTLGPWSSAAELINAREQAAAARQGKLKEGPRQAAEQRDAAWTPSRDPSLGPRPPSCRVPALLDLSLKLLVTHIDDVVSLWGVPDAIKVQLAAAVCARRAMSPAAAQLFAEHAPGEVVLPNCTQLDQEAMQQLLTTAASARLERLDLGCCGRGFTDAAARALLDALASRNGSSGGTGSGKGSSTGLPALTSLELQGAYNLSDASVAALLAAAPGLRRLAVPQGSKFDGGFVGRLPALLPRLQELDLAECRAVPGETLKSALPQMMALRRVTLDGIPEVDDDVVSALARLPSLSALSVAFCSGVTDKGITALIAARKTSLLELCLDDCARVTDASLASLAADCPRLHTLSVRRCAKLTDEGIAAVASRGALRRLAVAGVPGVGPATAAALARTCGGSLEFADFSFCRGVPEAGIGLLLDRCPKLCDLRLYGCTQITDHAVNGHSNEAATLRGLATSVRGGRG